MLRIRRRGLRTPGGAALLIAVLLLACAVAVSGCGGDSEPVVVPKPGTGDSTDASSPGEPGIVTPLSEIELNLTPLVTKGLESPLFVTHAGDGSGRIFVLEQTGRVRVVEDGKLLEPPYLDLSDRVSSGGERGLLGIAFAPQFERIGRFYVNYTNADGDTIVARYVADDPGSNQPGFAAPETVLRIDQPYANHNGGMIAFGPDRMLYIGMGDGGSGGDPENRAQNPRELLGKMLRIDVEGLEGRPIDSAGPYAIPKSNPYQYPGRDMASSQLLHRPEIWQSGLRNPWRFSFDRKTGDLWIGDVGQNAWEEIDFVPAGEGAGLNFGWNRYESAHPYPGETEPAERSGLTFPIVEYDHGAGESVTGGYVYRGSEFPALAGVYLYGDFTNGRIWGLRRTDDAGTPLAAPENALLLDSDLMLASFGEDESGELYAVDLSGGVYRITLKE